MRIELIWFLIFSGFFLNPKASYGQQKKIEEINVKITRGPYLQCVTPGSIVIQWRTNIPTSSKVFYGIESDNLDMVNQTEIQSIDHQVRITDLHPDTKYYYEIGNEGLNDLHFDASYYFSTSPKEIHDRPVKIWVLGDFGTGDNVARNVKKAYYKYMDNKHTDVWLMLGDIAYYHGKDAEFQRALFDNVYDEFLRNTVAWPAIGNHDGRSADSRTQSGPYYEVFSLPTQGEAGGYPSSTEAYYSFNYNNIHFVSLDSEESPRESDGEMAQWLKMDLERNLSQWLIVYFHHPPYTKGTHDSDRKNDSQGRMIEMRQNILPILEDYSVDLVLSGHSHVHERSHLIKGHYGSSESFKEKSMILCDKEKSKGISYYTKSLKAHGTMYIVCGVGCRKASYTRLDHPAMSFCTDMHAGSLSIEVHKNQLSGTFITSKGKIRDRFCITKVDDVDGGEINQ